MSGFDSDDERVTGTPTPYSVLAPVLMFIGLIGLLYFATRGDHSSSTPTNPEQVSTNLSQLKRCSSNYVTCVGGFAKLHEGGRIVRFDFPMQNKDPMVLFVNQVALGLATDQNGYSKKFDWVALPSDQRWDDAAIQFARQFVEHH